MKRLIKSLITITPYRIVRDQGANRFHAIDPCLRMLKKRGFSPRIILDCGAHVGSFSVATQQIFPDAVFHLVEPQPACRSTLQVLCNSTPSFVFHDCALGDRSGSVNLAVADEATTGAHVAVLGEKVVSVPAETLDKLFGFITLNDRALLKLDLQGYEMYALRGAAALLRSVEVILTEVSFYAQAYEPPIATLIAFLDGHGFVLYDIASLADRTRDSRPRQGDFIFVRKESPLAVDTRWD
ncbi:MAG TPA: FkbM family methyltransferase [Xanthobacteraceae bacterium]|jgi:FkbM family methyltransferase|nr:FkbM family methyltransferase [Xanthobacteraceae bacterium]